MNKDDLILARDLASQALHKATMAHEGSRIALDELRHAVNMFDAILFDKPMVHDEPEDAQPDMPELVEKPAFHTFEHGNHRYAFIDDIGTVITCERELGDSELDLLYGETALMRHLQQNEHYTGEGRLYQTNAPSQFHFIDDQYTEDNA
jgi:hypothetical protein